MVPGVYILLSPQEEEETILPEGADIHIQNYINQKDLNLCLTWKKHKGGIQLCYDVYNETKLHFYICFWFEWMSLSIFFPYTIEFEKISGFIFGLWLYDFWFYDTNDFESLLMPCWWKKKKTWVQRRPNIFQNVEKDL